MVLGIAAAGMLVYAAGDALADPVGLQELITKISGIGGYLHALYRGELPMPDVPASGFVAAILASLAVVVRGLTAFGVRPASLMATVSPSFQY
jgi:hypothetical protein